MNLILLYGPPAVGKLTVGEKLSQLTGIPLFHNHLTRDIVKDIYGPKLGDHYDLVNTLRHDVLAYCAQAGTDLIFTFVYEAEHDEAMLRAYIENIESNGGVVRFVELTATKEDLLDRVDNESRRQFKKLLDRSVLENMIATTTFSANFIDPVTIDTSKNTPDMAAQLIVDQLELQDAE
jgi:hypothetical protein